MDNLVKRLLYLVFPSDHVAKILSTGVRTWSIINASILAVMTFIMVNSSETFKIHDLPTFWSNNQDEYDIKVALMMLVLIIGSLSAAVVKSSRLKLLCGVSLLMSAVYQCGVIALYYVESPPFYGFMFLLIPVVVANYATGLHVCEEAKDELLADGKDVHSLLQKNKK